MRWGPAVAFAVVALALTAAATATTTAPNLPPALLTLQAVRSAGRAVTSQGPVHEKNYVAAYQRTFTFKTPSGASGLRLRPVRGARLGDRRSRRDGARRRSGPRSPRQAGRAAFAAAIAKSLRVKQSCREARRAAVAARR